MNVNSFDIEIKSLSWGSEDIVLIFDNQEISFYASYIDIEPVSSLILSLIALEEEIENLDYTRFFIQWHSEPRVLDFEMYKDKGKDHMKIIIKRDDDNMEVSDRTTGISFELPYSLYKNTVITTALKALVKYGLKGFNDSWSNGTETFPLNSLMSLLTVDSSFNKAKEDFHSDIFEELECIRQTLKTI